MNAEELRRLRADITYAMDLRHTYLDREETRWRILETVVSKPFRAFLDEVIERDRLARELARLEADRNPQEPGETLRAAGDGYEVMTWVTHRPSGVVVLPGHPQLGGRYCKTDGGDWPCAAVRAALEADRNPQETERERVIRLADMSPPGTASDAAGVPGPWSATDWRAIDPVDNGRNDR